jgi:hypothetical protein
MFAVSVGIRAVSVDCLVSQEETLVLPVKPQAIAVVLPLRGHFATPKVALVPVSQRPQGVTASPLPETVLVSPPMVLVARYEGYRNKPTLRRSRAQ